jgi:hypothetical protein
LALSIGLGIGIGQTIVGATLDATAPSRTGIATNAAGTKIIVSTDEALDAGSVPDLVDFALAGPVLSALTGTPVINGQNVELDVSPAIIDGETVQLSYTAGDAPVQDAAGNALANFTTQAVTNNSTHEYDPRDEGGAVLWVDMSDASSFTEAAGVITALTNKVSGGALTPVNSPAYQASGLNSLPCIDLNGTSQYFLGTEAAVVAAGQDNTPRTYICVNAIDTVDRIEAMFAWGNSGVGTSQTWVFGQSTQLTGRTNTIPRDNAAEFVNAVGTIAIDTTAHVYAFVVAGATAGTWIDGVADMADSTSVSTGGSITTNRYAIGGRPDSGPDNFFDGQKSEEWIFNKALSTAARQRVEAYLQAKWSTP